MIDSWGRFSSVRDLLGLLVQVPKFMVDVAQRGGVGGRLGVVKADRLGGSGLLLDSCHECLLGAQPTCRAVP